MTKITTADCVQAINAVAPLDLPRSVLDLGPRWKRISKRGRGGETITRIFSSRQAPWVKAVVEETPSGRLRVEFAQRHIWEIGPNEDVDCDDMDEWLAMPEIQSLPGPRPEEFAFGVGVERIWGDQPEVFVTLGPLGSPGWDQHLGPAVDRLLPRGGSGRIPGEICESTWILDYPDVASAREAMISRGFVHDPGMDGQMGS